MAMRSSWKGYLKLSLVSVPLQAFNSAVTSGGEIHFNQLHAECNSRIRYQKTCPIHGEARCHGWLVSPCRLRGAMLTREPEHARKIALMHLATGGQATHGTLWRLPDKRDNGVDAWSKPYAGRVGSKANAWPWPAGWPR